MSSLDTLIQKLAGAASSASTSESSSANPPSKEATLTDPVYVEKLASAVDFIIDTWGSEPEEVGTTARPELDNHTAVKTAAPVEEVPAEAVVEADINSVTKISELLKTKLQTKLASRREAESAAIEERGSQIAESVLGKLLELRGDVDELKNEFNDSTPEEVEDVIARSFYSDNNDNNMDSENESDSNEADGEAAIKAAAADQSLADVLNAALGTDEQTDESVQEDTKTAGVRGSDGSTKTRKAATTLLKEKLMAKQGEEAQS